MFKQFSTLVAATFLALSTALVPVDTAQAAGLAKEEVLKGTAPDFTLKNRAGGNLRLSELRGKVVMINFWASWCGPCRKELPLLNNLYTQYKDLDFVILGINIDADAAMADKLLKGMALDFPILLDPTSSVSTLYKVEAMPSSFFIDRDGNWRALHRGFEEGAEKQYEAHIRALLRE